MTMLFVKDEASDKQRPSWVKQIRSLSIILREEFGIPFRFYDASSGTLLQGLADDSKPPSSRPLERFRAPAIEGPLAVRLVAEGTARVHPLAGGRFQLALPFPDPGGVTTVAAGMIAGLAGTQADSLQEHARLGKWLQSVHQRLLVASQSSGRHRHRAGASSDRDGASFIGLEALMGLEQLLRTQRLDKTDDRSRKQILRTAATALRVRTLLWVPAEGDEALIEGESLLSIWDCGQLARLIVQESEGVSAGYLIDNQIPTRSWGARFPQIATALAVPVPVGSVAGWIIALNKTSSSAGSSNPGAPSRQTQPAGSSRGIAGFDPSSGPHQADIGSFRRTDAALLLPFAALLAVHVRAARKLHHSRELMVGLTRSLAAAVDARDVYITGHSERVARIAVEIARELGLRESELGDVYLGGLLHDVGKIGVPDAILRKRDPLTPEEFSQIRAHVTIGSQFLSELHPIAHLLPAVLHHHERYDGTGYPDGLKGEAIPFLSRILAVAESYDAMTTTRPGRPTTAVEHVDEIFARGAGTQWDGQVVAALFRCRDPIHAIQRREIGDPTALPTDAHDPAA
jgi:HD-GYP domain-containing protein (c-di-GMP phosphodiesterase class II)